MQKHHHLWPVLLLLALPILACGILNTEPAAKIPPPPTLTINTPGVATPVDELFAPTVTPFGATPLEPGTVVPGGPLISAIVDVNVRTGPGVQYERDGFLLAGESAVIIGQDPASGWWKIQCPSRSDGRECWVTGRSRYTTANDAADVPVAQAPPTIQPSVTATGDPLIAETPVSEVMPATEESAVTESVAVGTASPATDLIAPTTPLLVWVDNGDLFAATLSVDKEAPSLTQTRQLTQGADVIDVIISPQGQWIAYLQQNANGNALHVIRPDGSELTQLVDSAQLPQLPGLGTTTLAREIDQLQWTSDGEALAFNTRVAAVEPGVGPAFDFWTVELEADPIERLASGQAGGFFAISPENIVLSSGPTEIVRVRLDGSNREQVLSFEAVNTASEYAYVPEPQWLGNGRAARVALPGSEPSGPAPAASLMEIPANDLPGAFLGGVAGNILFDPPHWTADGADLAYIRRGSDGEAAMLELILANGDGSDPVSYAGSEGLRFLSWNPSGSRFLYSGNGFYAVGRPGQEPHIVDTPPASAAAEGRWVNDDGYLVAVGGGGSWQLMSSYQTAAPVLLVQSQSPTLIFDVMIP